MPLPWICLIILYVLIQVFKVSSGSRYVGFWIWHGCICRGYTEFWISQNMTQYAIIMPEYASICLNVPQYALKRLNIVECCWRSLNISENAWVKYSDYAIVILILIIIITIVTNIIILKLLPAWFIHPGASQLTTLSFFNTS